MRKTCAAVLAVCILAGCASGPVITNPNKSKEQAQADYNDCMGQAAMATALAPKGQDIEALREKKLDECMKQKGYEVTK